MASHYLYQKVYDDVLQDILSGKYPEGAYLPSEIALAEQYGVSRITSHRAMQELQKNGYILRTPGKGTWVAPQPREQKVIGLSLSDFDTLFGMDFIKGVVSQAHNRGYLVILQIGYFMASHETERLHELIAAGVRGIIHVPLYEALQVSPAMEEAVQTVPLVFADREIVGMNVPLVCTDNVAATEVLCRKLYENRHRHIAFVSSKTDSTAVGERYKGYIRFCETNEIPMERRKTFTGVRSVLPGMERPDVIQRDIRAIVNFLQENEEVTAIIAHTYKVGMLVLDAIRQLGRRVPEDYSVVCFDAPHRVDEAEFFSHMRQNENLMGARAVDRLLELMEGGVVPSVTYINAKYIEGQSCGEAR